MDTTTRVLKSPASAQMARADCCRLFAACFYPPDKKLLLEEALTDNLQAQLKLACPQTTLPAAPGRHHLENDGHMALSVAYTRLFLGPPEMLAPPYASFYLEKDGALMGPSSIKIAKFYDRAGLRINDDFNDMPDHITVMLEFLYYLLFQESLAQIDGTPEQRQVLESTMIAFVNECMMPWIARFCERITAADEHPFYNALGQCLDGFIHCGFAGQTG
jgi:putative dimethyl sulfoxide reductase chaperone